MGPTFKSEGDIEAAKVIINSSRAAFPPGPNRFNWKVTVQQFWMSMRAQCRQRKRLLVHTRNNDICCTPLIIRGQLQNLPRSPSVRTTTKWVQSTAKFEYQVRSTTLRSHSDSVFRSRYSNCCRFHMSYVVQRLLNGTEAVFREPISLETASNANLAHRIDITYDPMQVPDCPLSSPHHPSRG